MAVVWTIDVIPDEYKKNLYIVVFFKKWRNKADNAHVNVTLRRVLVANIAVERK
jgi:hypothetical protein